MELIVIAAIALVILFIFRRGKIEGYDARYTNISVDNCAKLCKTTAGCFGFAYDPKNQICYPSDNPLMGPPIKALYLDEYKDENVVCNKMDAIMIPTNAPPFDKRKSNAIFVCGEKPGLHPQLYIHKNNMLELIDEGQNPDFILDIDEYDVNYYKWPLNKYDADQLDLLRRDREKQMYTPSTMTLMDRIRNEKVNDNNDMIVGIDVKPKKESTLEKIAKRSGEIMTKLQEALQIPIGLNFVENYPNSDEYKAFEVYDKLNNGVYMRNHKCVQNIPMKSCLEYCLNNEECVGVEYNPRFFYHENVCCPYKSIDDFVDRRDMQRLGKFYRKIRTNNLDKKRIHVVY